MKKLILLISASIIFSYAFAQKALTLKKSCWPAASIDGITNSDEIWNELYWQNISLPVAAGNATSDMSAKFQIAYDDACLYFLGKATDPTPFDTLNAASNTHVNDCFEVFIGMDTSDYANSGAYKIGDYQFRFTGWVESTSFPARFDVGNGNPAPAGAIGKAVFTADPWMKIQGSNDGATTYYEEWAIPWRVLRKNMNPAWDCKQFKLDVQAADATPSGTSQTRTQQMFWGKNSDQAWQNTMDFGGLITLTTKVDTGFDTNIGYDTCAFSAIQNIKSEVFQISPNPVTEGYFNIPVYWSIELSNIIGQKCNVKNSNGRVDVSHFKAGLYFLSAYNKKGRLVGYYKLIIK